MLRPSLNVRLWIAVDVDKHTGEDLHNVALLWTVFNLPPGDEVDEVAVLGINFVLLANLLHLDGFRLRGFCPMPEDLRRSSSSVF